jgi:hypothetical protein
MPKLATLRSYLTLTILLTVFGLSFFGLSRPVRADLSIIGATNKQYNAIEDAFKNHIPARFHTGDAIDVQILSRSAMLAYIKQGEPDDQSADQSGDDTIDGIYEDGPPTVTLRSSGDIDDLSFTFAHEYGHYVWQDLLTKSERKRYEQIYDKQRAAHHLVTAYAATELDEGFAEAFSFYAMEPPVLEKRDPLSYRFLATLHLPAANSAG